MPTDASTYFLTQGVLGVLVVVLGGLSWKLYNKVQTLQDTMYKDAKETTTVVVNALNGNTQSNLVLAEKIEAGKRGQ